MRVVFLNLDDYLALHFLLRMKKSYLFEVRGYALIYFFRFHIFTLSLLKDKQKLKCGVFDECLEICICIL